jgi:hypothetical protein
MIDSFGHQSMKYNHKNLLKPKNNNKLLTKTKVVIKSKTKINAPVSVMAQNNPSSGLFSSVSSSVPLPLP